MSDLATVHRMIERVCGREALSTAEQVRPGMSGASVYRCHLSNGQTLAAKQWPASTTVTRVGEVHRLMTLARTRGCEFVPRIWSSADGASVNRDADGRCWEVADWLPGEPLLPTAAPVEIALGTVAIARFHLAVQTAGSVSQPAPAAIARLQRLAELDLQIEALRATAGRAGRFGNSQSRLGGEPDDQLAHALAQAVPLLLVEWPRVVEQIRVSLTPFVTTQIATQCVLRDVHRGHVLIQDGKMSGLIDYDAVRIDSPATDLARWISDFLIRVDSEPAMMARVWHASLAGYRGIRPFSAVEERLAVKILSASVWLSLANWLVWVLLENRRFAAGRIAVASRINELTRLAEILRRRSEWLAGLAAE